MFQFYFHNFYTVDWSFCISAHSSDTSFGPWTVSDQVLNTHPWSYCTTDQCSGTWSWSCGSAHAQWRSPSSSTGGSPYSGLWLVLGFLNRVFSVWKLAENAHFWIPRFSARDKCCLETLVVFSSFSACFRPHQTNTRVLEEKTKTTSADCFYSENKLIKV